MEQRSPALRWLVVWVVAVVWMGAVLARLGYLQLFRYSEYFAKRSTSSSASSKSVPKRGAIYDRKGRELAMSLPDGFGLRRSRRKSPIPTWWRGCFRAF